MKSFWLIFLLSFPSISFAAADIEGSVEIIGGNTIPAGTIARAIITVKNNGPDIQQHAVAGTFFFGTVGFRTLGVVRLPETAPCLLQFDVFVPPPVPPIRPATVFATLQTLTNLSAGQSVSCVVGVVTFPESPSVFRHRFAFGFLEDDPNPQNNEVFVQIRTRADPFVLPIPATSWHANVGLALGLLVLGCGVLRKGLG